MILALISSICMTPTVVDGDGIRCGKERIRLMAVDTPEMPGNCRRGRQCVPGDPFAAQRELAAFLRTGPVYIERIRIGAWGRTDAIVYVNGVSANCHMLARGGFYQRKYDARRRVARECGL